MVDIFPFLNYMPLWMAKWKRDALEWHERETKMFEDFYNDVGKQMVNFASGYSVPSSFLCYQAQGTARSSFVSTAIEDNDKNNLSVKEAAWLAGIML